MVRHPRLPGDLPGFLCEDQRRGGRDLDPKQLDALERELRGAPFGFFMPTVGLRL